VTDKLTLDPMQAFAELGRMDMASMELEDVLRRVAYLAHQSIKGAADVSLTLVEAGRGSTAAHTGERAMQLDEAQYQFGRGPCVDAAEAGAVFVIEDMENEDRWPDFTPLAAQQGVYSSVSVGLPMQPPISSSLNIYGDKAMAFGDETVATATTFAAYASVALANAHLYHSIAELSRTMHMEMSRRILIEQAKGVLVAQHKCTLEHALEIMTNEAERSHRKLRDVAEEVVSQATA
jgi:transcriptional regulator with GAF, ATPase, and Fis domain